ncbi:methyl-accepting chemotaxis protein [Arenibacterium sp. LLYu02]|uniref:methyl-accepting chemotaxis protein n=1 Tax=Arenibacterium sp. LLYu02 TaxID=3404132 RepID=UPI003B21513F
MSRNISQFGLKGLRRLNLLSSIRGKITFILLALTLMAGGAGYLTYQSFDRVSRSVGDMTVRDLPQLARSNALILAATKTKDAMIAVLMSQGSEELQSAARQVEAVTADLTDAVAAVSEDQKQEFEAEQAKVLETLQTLIDARANSFANTDRLNAMTLDLQRLAGGLQAVLLETADDAYFNISVKGEDTISSIEETLLDLTETKFATLQLVLEIRSEINFLSGLSLAMANTTDSSMLSIFGDLSLSSLDRLSGAMAGLDDTEAGQSAGAELGSISTTLAEAVSNGREGKGVDRDAVLATRLAADTLLSATVDDLVFDLTIAADDAATGNREAIQGLLDNEVAFINTLLEINSWLSAFQIDALKIASAQTIEQAQTAAQSMQAASAALVGFRDFGEGVLAEHIDGISELAQPETGLAAFRIKSLEANQAAFDAASATVEAVLLIGGQASLRGLESQNTITEQALGIASDAAKVQGNLEQIGWVALAFVGAALVMNHFLISRPLNAISRTTERLARGDMRPVKGFHRASDEIARIARALTVFRDGLVEKEELTAIAERERAENQARQTAAVEAIGKGLARLAHGDLTYQIEEDLTEGYAQLKEDFNTTAQSLKKTVMEVAQLASSIRSGSSEISQASDDLSQRTESQAATLEETAAALEELTTSVRAAATNARTVETTTVEARDQATESGQIVSRAVTAMKDIESSSTQIGQIIGVIDDIAFQTNLLALNAGVEAARAGEAGRGFAVVASEVRGLSQRTAEAAREIKALISKSSTQVEAGVTLVGQTGQALSEIVERVTHISRLVSAIAESTNEQATGLGEANIAVSQLDQVTQQNAAMVEETNAASQLLSQDSQKLATLMANFTVEASRSSAAWHSDRGSSGRAA